MPDLLILRPEPGAGETAERARAMGLTAAVAPIFEVRATTWQAPDPAAFQALLLTSANAARTAGPALAAFAHLTCYAVGERSAAAATKAGFREVWAGLGDGATVIELMVSDGVRRAFHPCGRDHIPLSRPGIHIERRVVYASDAVSALPREAVSALNDGAVGLIHSPRAAARFAALADRAGIDRGTIALAAISDAAAQAAGSGWKRLEIAAAPRDEALLELAARLCKTGLEIKGRDA
jgi:uroporphyrinogen-III synthase